MKRKQDNTVHSDTNGSGKAKKTGERDENGVVQGTSDSGADKLTSTGPSVSPQCISNAENVAPSEEKSSCVVCMCSNDECVLLPTHNCPTCKSDAWKICEDCDEVTACIAIATTCARIH